MSLFFNNIKNVIKLNTLSQRQKSKAFTVIEIAVGMMIVSLIYMTVSPAIVASVNNAKTSTTSNVIEESITTIDDFFKKNGRFPDSLEEVFDEVPIDPWGNPYQYTNIQNAKGKGKGKFRKDKNLVPINSDYDFYSMGPDGKTASPLTAAISQDDIVRGRNGLFVGVAADY